MMEERIPFPGKTLPDNLEFWQEVNLALTVSALRKIGFITALMCPELTAVKDIVRFTGFLWMVRIKELLVRYFREIY